MERWLLGLPSVGNQPGDKIDDKVGLAAVTGMFNLRDILELVNDGPDDEALTRERLVFENKKVDSGMFLRMGVIGNGRSAAINCSPRAQSCSKRAWQR